MSFSTKAKNHLARIMPERRCCQLAETLALLRMDGLVEKGADNLVTVHLHTENAAVARKVIKMLKNLFDLSTEISIQRKVRLKKNYVYSVNIPPQEKGSTVLKALGLKAGAAGLKIDWNTPALQNNCCRRAYLRGAFLGGGSVSDPEGTYHLELITREKQHLELLCRIMAKIGLEPRVSRRKHWFVVYLKDSAQISDFLNIIGAHAALLDFENAKIMKEMRNKVNRLVNCETANLNKTIDAGMRQVAKIELLIKKIGYERIPFTLKETARLRLEYPEASLKELGEMLEPQASKSAVNHRLRRLEKMAEKLQ